MRGGLHVVVNARAIVGAVAKQQFVGDERAVAVEDRLAPDIDALSAPRGTRVRFRDESGMTKTAQGRAAAL